MKKLSLLKIGNLYEGWWLDNSREKMNIFWLESGEQVSLSCFVLLEKKRSKKASIMFIFILSLLEFNFLLLKRIK